MLQVLPYDLRPGAANRQLRTPAIPVPEDMFGSPELMLLFEDMAEFVAKKGAKGLAANQVKLDWLARGFDHSDGSHDPPAMFVVSFPDEGKVVSACNPELSIPPGDWELGEEGCLSFREVMVRTKAPRELTLRARTAGGEPWSARLTGFEARAAYHEAEHLRGRTILARLGPLARRYFLRDVQKAARREGAR